MLIYNVTLKVENGIADEWLRWMQEEHIPELIQTGLFCGHKLCHLLEQDETEGVTFIAQYFLDSAENYEAYISQHAPRMREKGFTLFGSRFIAFRTLMETLD